MMCHVLHRAVPVLFRAHVVLCPFPVEAISVGCSKLCLNLDWPSNRKIYQQLMFPFKKLVKNCWVQGQRCWFDSKQAFTIVVSATKDFWHFYWLSGCWSGSKRFSSMIATWEGSMWTSSIFEWVNSISFKAFHCGYGTLEWGARNRIVCRRIFRIKEWNLLLETLWLWTRLALCSYEVTSCVNRTIYIINRSAYW